MYILARDPRWSEVRDSFLRGKRCVCCNRSVNLVAHHIRPYYLFPELELNPSNLIPLCEGGPMNCHFLCGHGGRTWFHYVPNPMESVRRVQDLRKELYDLASTQPPRTEALESA